LSRTRSQYTCTGSEGEADFALRLIKKELQPIKAAKWDRLIPCHGDVIETGGKNAWNTIWGPYE